MLLNRLFIIITIMVSYSLALAQWRSVASSPQKSVTKANVSSVITRLNVDIELVNTPLSLFYFEVPAYTALSIVHEGIVENGKINTLGRQVSNQFRLRSGERGYFGIGFKNDSAQDIYFYASPLFLEPADKTLDFMMELGLKKYIFRVPAKSTRYFIGNVLLGPLFYSESMTIKSKAFLVAKEQLIRSDLSELVK